MSVKKPAQRPPPLEEFQLMAAPGNGGLPALTVHATKTPRNQETGLLKALRARRVPGWLLYRSPEQARRWLDYHAAWSPSRIDPSLGALYQKAAMDTAEEMTVELAEELAEEAGEDSGKQWPPLLAGLGCGGGAKDAAVLKALAKFGGDGLAYAPVDASPELVLRAAAEAAQGSPGVSLHPLVADLSAGPPLAGWFRSAAAGNRRRLFTAYGMLPNMHHRAFPHWLAGLLEPGDRLLISANLFPASAADGRNVEGSNDDVSNPEVSKTVTEGILAQYDNPPGRRWFSGCLSELGLPGEAYRLTIEAIPLEDSGETLAGAFQVSVRASFEASVRINPSVLESGGEEIVYEAGEELSVFHSNRFTAGTVQLLLEQAGLTVTRRWIHASEEEGIFACYRH